MKISTAIMVVLLSLCVTGCQTASHTMVSRDNLPGHRYSNIVSPSSTANHQLTKTRNGVYVYKDNVIYNTTEIDPHAGMFGKSKPLDFGPNVINFGPKDVQYR